MKKQTNLILVSLLAAILCLCVVSCGSSVDNKAKELLSTVPSDASVVSIINIKSIVEQIADDSKLQKQLGSINDKTMRVFVDADNGIEKSVCVSFLSGPGKIYLTGFVEDVDKFRACVKKNEGIEWTNRGDIEIAGNYILTDKRFWISQGSETTADDVQSFLKLAPEKSVLEANERVADLLPLDKDIEFMIDNNRLMSNIPMWGNVQQMGMMKTIADMMVKDSAFTVGYVAFGKEDITLSTTTLNSKGEPAESTFKLNDIDESLLKRLPKSSQVVFAVGTSRQMWTTLVSVARSYASMLGETDRMIALISPVIEQLDGTLMFGASNEENMTLIAQTKDKEGAKKIADSLNVLLGSLNGKLKIEADGNCVEISLGTSERGYSLNSKQFKSNNIAAYIGKMPGMPIDNIKAYESVEIYGNLSDMTSNVKVNINKGNHPNALCAVIADLQLK